MNTIELHSTWDYVEEYSNLVDALWGQHALTRDRSQKAQIENRIFNILKGIDVLERKSS